MACAVINIDPISLVPCRQYFVDDTNLLRTWVIVPDIDKYAVYRIEEI